MQKQQSTKSLPQSVNEYLADHQIESYVNRSLNKVLREKPSDPLTSIAGQLLKEAKESLPVFERFEASRVFLYESLQNQTIKINVFMQYQGRTDMRYSHIFSYDPEEQDKFLYDNKADKTGVDFACHMINTELTQALQDKAIDLVGQIDQLLLNFYQKKLDAQQEIGTNIIKGCSEALFYAVLNCCFRNQIYRGFRKLVYQDDSKSQTKLMFTILNGGKSLGSSVKFNKFYLIIEQPKSQDLDIVDCFIKFQQVVKKSITSTKAGETGFKPGPEGSYFNAFSNINESFKVIEDAITASGANTADQKIFKIGLNCEGDSYFNKDPKDANKYEVEGVKNQQDQNQVSDYYIKICNDHPLVAYIEDPFANVDIKGWQTLANKLKSSGSQLKFGARSLFNDGNLDKIRQLTEIVDESQPEQNKDKISPHIIHINRTLGKIVSDVFEYQNLSKSYSNERQFQIIFDDNKFESTQTSIVDFAFGFGAEYLNVNGFTKIEKLAKKPYMELLRIIREESGIFPKFERVLSKSTQDELLTPLQQGRNILHFLCSQGYTRYLSLTIKELIKRQILPESIDFKEQESGQSPLFYAMRAYTDSSPEIINLLIKSGCNVNLRDKLGKSPVHYASELGQDDILTLLITNGANVNFQDIENKRTPLHEAIMNGQLNSFKIL